MTLAEFKAWFEGFTEDMSGAPTEKQWKKIKARVAEITGTPVTERHFYDHYWHPRYYPYLGWSSTSYQGASSALGASTGVVQLSVYNNAPAWDSSASMQALGRADALLAA
jgi:hypothetical protein